LYLTIPVLLIKMLCNNFFHFFRRRVRLNISELRIRFTSKAVEELMNLRRFISYLILSLNLYQKLILNIIKIIKKFNNLIFNLIIGRGGQPIDQLPISNNSIWPYLGQNVYIYTKNFNFPNIGKIFFLILYLFGLTFTILCSKTAFNNLCL